MGRPVSVLLAVVAMVALLPLPLPSSAHTLLRRQSMQQRNQARSNLQQRLSVTQDVSSFYHTSEQLMHEYRKLAASCPGMEISNRASGPMSLPVVRIKQVEQPPHRALFFFGEHSREMISSESGLAFARALCSSSGPFNEKVQRVLAQTDIMIVPNINPDGRLKVEQGQYCWRGNGRGVDLNRNWDDHWATGSVATVEKEKKAQSWGGHKPFSERETQILHSLADEFNPSIFVTVHSGTLGMYMPYAWNGKLVDNKADSDAMMGVLNKLNPQYCACSAGSAGKEVGYLCPGTCLDYMYDKLGTKFAFGYEIWDGETTKGFSNVGTAEGKAFLEMGASLNAPMHQHGPPSPARASLRLNEDETMLLELEERVSPRHQARLQPSENSRGAAPPPRSSAKVSPFPEPTEPRTKSCLNVFNPASESTYKAT